MHYQTMMLELIQEHPTLYRKLCSRRTVLPTLKRYARILKSRHQYWMDQLYETDPAQHRHQISRAGLSLAVDDLQETLSADSPPVEDGWEPSLDETMAYLRRHTLPA